MKSSQSWCGFCVFLCPVADSFDHKKFFELVGLKSKSADDVKKVFTVLDADNSGFIEEEELKWDKLTHALKHTCVCKEIPKRVTIIHTKAFCDTNPIFFASSRRFVLKGFAKDGRDLTDKETKAFLKAADKDGDGKIGVDGKRNTNTSNYSIIK